jgi:hypothetical protein
VNSALGNCFALGALALLLRRRTRFIDVAGAVVLFVVGLLSREVVIVVPAILLVARYQIDGSQRRLARLRHGLVCSVPLWLVAGVYLVIRLRAGTPPAGNPYAQRLSLHAFSNIGRLAQIATDTERFKSTTAYALFVIAGWLVLAVLCAIAAVRSGRWQGLFGLAWALVAVLPVIFLVNHTMDYYYIDLALPGLAIAVGTAFEWSISTLSSHGQGAIAFGLFGVLILVSLNTARVQERANLDRKVWRTSQFVRQVERENPNPPKGSILYVKYSNPADIDLTVNGHLFRVIYHDPTLIVRYVYDPN